MPCYILIVSLLKLSGKLRITVCFKNEPRCILYDFQWFYYYSMYCLGHLHESILGFKNSFIQANNTLPDTTEGAHTSDVIYKQQLIIL